MKKRVKKLISVCLVFCITLTQMLFANTASAVEVTKYQRLSGSDRYKTAVAISKAGWKTSSYAVLARGDDFADALCAGPLAKKFGAPILLTQPNELNADVLAELKRLGVKHVFIAGGTGAVSSSVESVLKSAGIATIDRLYGADRFETSVKVAEKLGTVDMVVLATGMDFPDALSISAVAAKQGIPILLTGKDSMPLVISKYLSGKSISKSYVIGGTGVISDTVKNAAPNAVRLGGKDRYETNVLVMQEFASVLSFTDIYVAVGEGSNGNEFADALSGAVLAAQTSSPVVLAYSTLPDVTANFIKTKVSIASRATALGGEAVVSSSILDSITSYVEQIKITAKYDKAGTYGTAAGTDTVSGNVVISAADVILQNTVIEGDLLLEESIGSGNVTLKNVTVKGTTTVRGGGPNSVIMYNFNGQTVVVDVPDGGNVRLVAQGTTNVQNVVMNSDGKLQEDGVTGNGFTTVAIPQGAQVTLAGSFNTVSVEASGANVNVESGSIGTLNVAESAANSDINVASNASVATLQVSAPVDVTGTGTISTANINSEGVSIAQNPSNRSVAPGISASIGGSTVTGSTQSTGGGGGGGGSSSSSDSDSGSSTVTAAPELSAAASIGITKNTAKVSAAAGSGNHLVVKVSSSSIGTPNVGDSVPTGSGVTNPYTSGANITGVDATTNKYIAVYEANSSDKVVKFKLITLTVNEICTFELTSSAFTDNSTIPVKYGNSLDNWPGAENISIPLSWTGVPSSVNSFALIMHDVDANDFIHWAVIDITANTTSISEGASSNSIPAGSTELRNTFGDLGYGGPQPPQGVRAHTYKIVVYALNSPVTGLDTTIPNSYTQLQQALTDKIIAQSEVTGTFERSNGAPGAEIAGLDGILQIGEATTATAATTEAGRKTWASSDITVALIEPSMGIVTALKAGTATISYITDGSAKVNSKTITVYAAAVVADPTIGTVQVGEEDVTPTGFTAPIAGQEISWLSSDTSKATIVDGKVHAVAAGDTTISYKVVETATGRVVAKGSKAVTVVNSSLNINLQGGQTYNGNFTFTAEGTYGPADGTTATVIGNVTIAGENITLRNTDINGNLIINNDSTTTLQNVHVLGTGKIIVTNTGTNSLHLDGVSAETVEVSDSNGASIVTDSDSNNQIQNINLEPDNNNKTITLQGDFDQANVNIVNSASVQVKGYVDVVNIEGTVDATRKAQITMDEGGNIGELNIQKDAVILGKTSGVSEIAATIGDISGTTADPNLSNIKTTVTQDYKPNIDEFVYRVNNLARVGDETGSIHFRKGQDLLNVLYNSKFNFDFGDIFPDYGYNLMIRTANTMRNYIRADRPFKTKQQIKEAFDKAVEANELFLEQWKYRAHYDSPTSGVAIDGSTPAGTDITDIVMSLEQNPDGTTVTKLDNIRVTLLDSVAKDHAGDPLVKVVDENSTKKVILYAQNTSNNVVRDTVNLRFEKVVDGQVVKSNQGSFAVDINPVTPQYGIPAGEVKFGNKVYRGYARIPQQNDRTTINILTTYPDTSRLSEDIKMDTKIEFRLYEPINKNVLAELSGKLYGTGQGTIDIGTIAAERISSGESLDEYNRTYYWYSLYLYDFSNYQAVPILKNLSKKFIRLELSFYTGNGGSMDIPFPREFAGKAISIFTSVEARVPGLQGPRPRIAKNTCFLNVDRGASWSDPAFISVLNNAGYGDDVSLMGLMQGEVIKVYTLPTGGEPIAQSDPVGQDESEAKVSIPQLGVNGGKVYISLWNQFKGESPRLEKDYEPEASIASISANSGGHAQGSQGVVTVNVNLSPNTLLSERSVEVELVNAEDLSALSSRIRTVGSISGSTGNVVLNIRSDVLEGSYKLKVTVGGISTFDTSLSYSISGLINSLPTVLLVDYDNNNQINAVADTRFSDIVKIIFKTNIAEESKAPIKNLLEGMNEFGAAGSRGVATWRSDKEVDISLGLGFTIAKESSFTISKNLISDTQGNHPIQDMTIQIPNSFDSVLRTQDGAGIANLNGGAPNGPADGDTADVNITTFKLSAEKGDITINNRIELNLTNINGISDGDFTDIKLFDDTDGNGTPDTLVVTGTMAPIDGANKTAVISFNLQNSALTFIKDTAGKNYIVQMDIKGWADRDTFTISSISRYTTDNCSMLSSFPPKAFVNPSSQSGGNTGSISTSGGRVNGPNFIKDDTITITVNDSDLNTNNATQQTVNVVVKSSVTDTQGITVTLTENGVNSNQFIGRVIVADASDTSITPKKIGARIGETITITYVDALDQPGNVNRDRVTSAYVVSLLDLSPTVILVDYDNKNTVNPGDIVKVIFRTDIAKDSQAEIKTQLESMDKFGALGSRGAASWQNDRQVSVVLGTGFTIALGSSFTLSKNLIYDIQGIKPLQDMVLQVPDSFETVLRTENGAGDNNLNVEALNGQVDGDIADVNILTFKSAAEKDNVSINKIEIVLTQMISITDSEITDIKLFEDTNADGTPDNLVASTVNKTLIVSGSMTITLMPDSAMSIVKDAPGKNYIVQVDVLNWVNGHSFKVSNLMLYTSGNCSTYTQFNAKVFTNPTN